MRLNTVIRPQYFFLIRAHVVKEGRGIIMKDDTISRQAVIDTEGLDEQIRCEMCRNPMHMGAFLFYLGLGCAVNSLLSLVVPFGFLLFAYCFAVFSLCSCVIAYSSLMIITVTL